MYLGFKFLCKYLGLIFKHKTSSVVSTNAKVHNEICAKVCSYTYEKENLLPHKQNSVSIERGDVIAELTMKQGSIIEVKLDLGKLLISQSSIAKLKYGVQVSRFFCIAKYIHSFVALCS